MSSSDVVVIGGGLVGLALVCALKDNGLRVSLIEAQPAPDVLIAPADPLEPSAGVSQITAAQYPSARLVSGVSPRVSAINNKSRTFLTRIGGWPQSGKQGTDYTKMAVWDTEGTGSICFTADEIQQEYLGTIVENTAVLSQLYKTASGIENLELNFDTTLETIEKSDTGYLVHLGDGRQVECQLLVGADGGNSRVRTLAGLKSVDWSYHQTAIVTTVAIEKPHSRVARQWFTEQGPLAFLPLENPNYCSIVWSCKDPGQITELSDPAFCQLLTGVVAKEFGAVVACDKRFSFPLTQRHAVMYSAESLVLIGDAAHTIHPLAGQGVNLGFADAQALARVLNQCIIESRSPGELKLLREYENRRKPENLLMAAVMEGFKRLFGTQDPGMRWLRNTGLRLVDSNHMLKNMAAKLASGS